uniref:Uncharacterized protein n=1 Tax=Zea mays TaxID=4577 RepID=A0A804UHP4_MAIZE
MSAFTVKTEDVHAHPPPHGLGVNQESGPAASARPQALTLEDSGKCVGVRPHAAMARPREAEQRNVGAWRRTDVLQRNRSRAAGSGRRAKTAGRTQGRGGGGWRAAAGSRRGREMARNEELLREPRLPHPVYPAPMVFHDHETPPASSNTFLRERVQS